MSVSMQDILHCGKSDMRAEEIGMMIKGNTVRAAVKAAALCLFRNGVWKER